MRRVHASLDRGAVGGRSLRQGMAFFWAIFAVALASTERATQASCGDYVMVGGSHHGRVDQSPAGSRDVPFCTGKHCQRQLPLAPASKPLVPTSSQELACFPSGVHSECNGPASLVFEPSPLSSQAVSVPPDRPPRVSL
jgi:hypothetical protein